MATNNPEHKIPRDIIHGHVYHKPKGKPYAHGSTLAAMEYAARKGYAGVDWDRRVDKDGKGWWVHQAWPTKRDAWFDPDHHINDSHRIENLTSAQVGRLRYRNPDDGKVYAIMSDRVALERFKALGLIPCVEDKTFRGFSKAHWAKFKALADEIGVVPIIMSLPGAKSEPGRRKLQGAHDAGLVTMWLWRKGSVVPSFVDLVKSKPGRGIHRVSKRPLSGSAPTPAPKPPAPKPPAAKPPAKSLVDRALDRAAQQSKHGPRFGINQCKMRVRLLYSIPSDGAATAAIAWRRTKHKHTGTKAVRGGFYWWVDGSSGAGHVTLATGNGDRCWSTDIKRTGFFDLTTVTEINRKWPKLRYVGWSEDIDGVRVINVPSAPKPPVKPSAGRMPGAKWLGEHSPKAPMTRHDIVCVHTIVGRAPAHAAHFSTHANGDIDQSRSTKYKSAANLNGNHRIIAIENEDMGGPFPKWGGSDVPPLTDAQVTACAKILAWAHKEHGVPLQLCPNSKPGSRGLAYHRQGIDGNFGSFKFPGRVKGGEVWTEHFGKVCPGDRRIAQLPEILAQARRMVDPSAPEPRPHVSKPNRVQRARELSAEAVKLQREANGLLADAVADDADRHAVRTMHNAWIAGTNQITAATAKGPKK